MKYDTYAEYDPKGAALANPALLTVWAGLTQYHEDLVLVGGLVPHYICRHPTDTGTLPRPVTLDVDIGIALGASNGQYGTISASLSAQGFRPSEKFPSRFEKTIKPFTIYLDFLVDRPPATQGTTVVDDIPANILPGIDRALASARTMSVAGKDLFGTMQNLQLRVCEAGPYLVLKLRAFARRQEPKDAFDILYTLLHYDGGTAAALTAFAVEAKSNNPAMREALVCLEQHFTAAEHSGPNRAAHFIFGEEDSGESGETRFRRLQLRQDVVAAGQRLLATVAKG